MKFLIPFILTIMSCGKNEMSTPFIDFNPRQKKEVVKTDESKEIKSQVWRLKGRIKRPSFSTYSHHVIVNSCRGSYCFNNGCSVRKKSAGESSVWPISSIKNVAALEVFGKDKVKLKSLLKIVKEGESLLLIFNSPTSLNIDQGVVQGHFFESVGFYSKFECQKYFSRFPGSDYESFREKTILKKYEEEYFLELEPVEERF